MITEDIKFKLQKIFLELNNHNIKLLLNDNSHSSFDDVEKYKVEKGEYFAYMHTLNNLDEKLDSIESITYTFGSNRQNYETVKECLINTFLKYLFKVSVRDNPEPCLIGRPRKFLLRHGIITIQLQ